MATYYIRKTGSDSNAGTSAGAAWLTLGKALGASGIASGDTVYVGAGIYREVVTINMTSAIAETKIIGDVTGAFTGDAGEVRWTGYLTNDQSASSSTTLLNLNGRDFLTFEDIYFQAGNAVIITGTTATSTDIKFLRCAFAVGHRAGNSLITHTTAANVAANWTIDSCIFLCGSSISILFTLTRPATADFDYNIQIKNCLFVAGSNTQIRVDTTGANSFNGGGVSVRNCTVIGGSNFVATAANTSTSIPCTVYNCFICNGATALNANASGQIVENYNCFMSTGSPRTNVTAGANSVSENRPPIFYIGHEFYSVGSALMPFGMPKPESPLLGFGNQASSPTTDILGAARPSGTVQKLAEGTATAGAATTLTDSGAAWGTNVFAGHTIKIISGTGSGQTKNIASNTATVITVDGNWKTNPSTDSVYEVYSGANSSSGTATSGTTTSLTDSNAAWGTNQWAGYTLEIDGGTGSGQSLLVTSNTATALSFATATAPDNTSTYKLYRGTNENTINAGVGCYEYSDSSIKETGTVRTGSNAIRIPGAGYHDFEIPVDASSTTVTIYTRWDSRYSGTKPSMSVLNGGECGVADATDTATGSADTWEQLSLTFTPTSKGIVTIRLVSSSTTPTGNSFWDDFDIS